VPKEVHADEIEVVDEETVSNDSDEPNNTKAEPKTKSINKDDDEDLDIDDQGQVVLF
jgi:topoisomerase-4 subunit A